MPNKPLKVFFFPTANAGIVFYRMLNFFRTIRKNGVINCAMDKFDPKRATPYEWQFPENKSSMLLQQMDHLIKQADVLVFGYIITDYGVAILQSIKELYPDKPIVMEIDDYCLSINSYSPAFSVYRPGSTATNAILEQLNISDSVVVSTPYLKRLYSEFNDKIVVMRNGIDFDVWDRLQKPSKKAKNIRIGWAGGSNHSEDIRYIEPVIYKILKKYPNVEFYFYGGFPEFLKGKHSRIKGDHRWADIYEYPQALRNRNFDIGIAPLLDNNFNRAKSNLRWLEYSALKIPTVASNVEDFRETIKHGDNGFLCTELDEWENTLSSLIESPAYGQGIGQRAYNTIKRDFNVAKTSVDYEKFLKELHNGFSRSKNKVPSLQS